MPAVLAVLLGGAIGTALRLGLDDLFATVDTRFPVSTLIINIVGSFALAFLTARVWPHVAPWIRAGIGPGLLGGFTTFSAVMVSMVTFASTGRVVIALAYLVVTLVGGFGAAFFGLRLGSTRVPRTAPPVAPVDEVNE